MGITVESQTVAALVNVSKYSLKSKGTQDVIEGLQCTCTTQALNQPCVTII